MGWYQSSASHRKGSELLQQLAGLPQPLLPGGTCPKLPQKWGVRCVSSSERRQGILHRVRDCGENVISCDSGFVLDFFVSRVPHNQTGYKN